jgi:hypothetical protein
MNQFIANNCLIIGLIITGVWAFSIAAVCAFFHGEAKNPTPHPKTDAARIRAHHNGKGQKIKLKNEKVLFLRAGKGFQE